MLILETHNDYVRFHGTLASFVSNASLVLIALRTAYQSALLTGPLLLLRIIAALLQFPSVLCTFLTLLLVVSCLYMAYVFHLHNHFNNLIPLLSVLAGGRISTQQRMD